MPTDMFEDDDKIDKLAKTFGVSLPKETVAAPKKKQELLEKMRGSTSTQESSGDSSIVNPDSGATGEFQVMPFNIPNWTRKYYGRELTQDEFRKNPQAQRAVFDGEMGSYLEGALKIAKSDEEAVRMAAVRWYGGNYDQYDDPTPQYSNGKRYPSRREYTTKVANRVFGSKPKNISATNFDVLAQKFLAPSSSPDKTDKLSRTFLSPAEVVPNNTSQNQPSLTPSEEPPADFLKQNGLVAETPDDAVEPLLNIRSRIQEELSRAKTEARRKILQKRLEEVEKNIKNAAKTAAAKTVPQFQPVENKEVNHPFSIKDSQGNTYFQTPFEKEQNFQPGEARYFRDGAYYIADAESKIRPENPPKTPLSFQTEDGRTLLESGNQSGLQPGEIRVRDIANDKGGNYIAVKNGDKYSLRREGESVVKSEGFIDTGDLSKEEVGDVQAEFYADLNNTKNKPKPMGKPVPEAAKRQSAPPVENEIELRDGRKLKKSANQENLADGTYRFETEDGETWVVNPQEKKVYEESANEIFEKIQVNLVPRDKRISIDVEAAKDLYVSQVADYLAKKYDGTISVDNEQGIEIRQEDAKAWLKSKGVRDLETNQPFRSEQYYANPVDPAGQTGNYSLTKKEFKELAAFSAAQKLKVENAALSVLASKGELTAEDLAVFKKYGLDVEKLQRDRRDDYEMALSKGEVVKKDYARRRPEFDKTESDPYLADIKTQIAVGMRSRANGEKLIRDYEALREQKREELAELAERGASPQLGGVNLARIGDVNSHTKTPAQIESETTQYLQNIIGKFGSASAYFEKKKQEEIEKEAANVRVLNMGWGEYLKSGVFGVAKTALNTAVAGTWRGIALGAKTLDDLTWGSGGKRVEDYTSSKIADNWERWTNYYLPTEEDIQKSDSLWGFFGADVPQGVGSSIGMAVGGFAKNPKAAIAVLSSLQMGGDAYKEARAQGATYTQAQLAALLQAPLGVTEIFGMGKILERLNSGKGASVWRRLFMDALIEGGKEVPEEIFQEGGQTIASNLIKNKVYNPDQKWADGVLKAMAAAGFSAGLMSSGVSILNTVRNRGLYKKMIALEEARGVVIEHYGENEVYAFGQKIAVNPETKPLIDSYENSRKGIEEIQGQIEAIKNVHRNKPIADKRRAVEQIRTLRTELEALQKRQAVISRTLVEKAGIEIPSGKVGDALTANNSEEVQQALDEGNTEKFVELNQDPPKTQRIEEMRPGIPTVQTSSQESQVEVGETEKLDTLAEIRNIEPAPTERVSKKQQLPPDQPVLIEGKGEGVVVEDKGNSVVVDYNDGKSRTVVRKNKLSVAGEKSSILKTPDKTEPQTKEVEEVEKIAPNSSTKSFSEKMSERGAEGLVIPPKKAVSNATEDAFEAATSPSNDLPEPTQAQIEAGNYKKGHISINGLDISVENPVGSQRKGVDRDGKPWSVTMKQHYGYFKRTVGADTENIDVFVKNETPSDFAGDVFIVNQIHPDNGEFDEHKVMLGFSSEDEARRAYQSNYAKDWKGLNSITAMSFAEFKDWTKSEQSQPADKEIEITKQFNKESQSNQAVSRNFRAGTNDATITFDSETQRDLFDYYANEKKKMSGGGQRAFQSRVKDLSELKTDLANRLGVSESEVFRIAKDVSEDVKTQMKGVQHLEERKVDDNVLKNNDAKTPQTAKEKKLEKLSKPSKPRSAPKADTKKHSLSTFIQRQGGLNDGGVIDVSAVKNARGGRFIVGKNRQNVEDAFRNAVEAGYFADKNTQYSPGAADVANQNYDFTVDDFVEAVAADANGFRKYYSTDNESYYNLVEQDLPVSSEEFEKAATIAEFLSDKEVQEIIKSLEQTGELTDNQRQDLFEIGHYVKRIEAQTVRDTIQELIREANRKSSGASIDAAIPETVTERVEAGSQNSESIYNEEIDETEPEGEVDLSFDFADEEKPQNTQYRENLFGEEIAPTRQDDLFGNQKTEPEKPQERLLGNLFDEYSEDNSAPIAQKAANIVLKLKSQFENMSGTASFLNDVEEGLRAIHEAEITKQPFEQYLNQGSMFGEVELSSGGREVFDAISAGNFADFVTKKLGEIRNTPHEIDELKLQDIKETAETNLAEIDKINQKSAVEAENIPTVPITDFGEKIGGARKDLALGGYQMTGGKPQNEQPQWMKNFHLGETEDGKFQPFLAKDRFVQWRSREMFDTKEEAITAIKLFNIARKFFTRRSENGYQIYRKVSDRKRHTIKDGFASEEEAKTYLVKNLDEFLNYKPEFPERPHIEDLQRTGTDYRNGQNISPEKFSNEFGFTGVEFGNWIPQDERQRLLNMAYDGLRDLADVLQIPPQAVSLNGQLSIAFGSRGQGLSKAAAHYERNRAVFNLTRMNGAGSVSHEWFHAVDHYLGAQDRGETLAKNEKGIVESVKGRDQDFLSHGTSYRSQARKEMVEAFVKVIKTIFKQPKIVEVSVARYESHVEKSTKDLGFAIGRLKQHLETDKRYTRKKTPATAEQITRFDGLVEKIQKGEFGEILTLETKSRWKTIPTFQVFKDLNDLVIEITGRSELRNNPQGYGQTGMVYDLQIGAKSLQTAQTELAKYQIDNKETRNTPTKYYYDAKDIDAMRSGDYWSTEHEMAARAFEAYVEDKLKERGDKSQYLVHSTENSLYEYLYGLSPYPKGEERVRINEAFDDFFNILETEETDKGIMLKSVLPDGQSSPYEWQENFPPISAQTTGTVLKSHPDYKAAKAGDVLAAKNVIESVVKIDKIRKLAERHPDAIVVPVHAEESAGRNKLPLAFAAYIAVQTGLTVHNTIVQTNKTSHTGSKAIHRLFAVPEFSGEVIPGKEYIIVDDATTSGSTFKALKEFIEERGGKVVEAATLFNAFSRQLGYGGNLAILPETISELQQKFAVNALNELLFNYGIAANIRGLTNGQGKYFLSFNSVDSIRNKFIKEGFERFDRYSGATLGQNPPDLRDKPGQLKSLLDPNPDQSEKPIIERMKELPFVSLDELLPLTKIEQFGDKIKANPESHELYRRAFEQAKIESGVIKRGSGDYEDLFRAIFIPPETVQKTAEILRSKADEAQKAGYSAEEVAVLETHAAMLETAAAGNTTAIIYIFDEALPEEVFHQADYLGAAEKTILNRHDEATAGKLDSSRVTQVLWMRHFSRFKEYNRLSPKVLKAVLRAEIPPFLLEMSAEDLAKYNLTEDERDDYLLTWFEGYAAKNGIDALDNFEREELNVQEFIEKVKEARQVRQDGQGNEESFAPQREQGGKTTRGPPVGEQKQDRRLSTGSERGEGLDKNQKQASLPATLRAAGIEADDVIYEIFGDKPAQASARKMLEENGIEGAIKILRSVKEPDVDHAILSFMIQRVLLDNAAELAATNPENAENLRALALKLGREHSLKAVKAGRFTRAASIIQNSVEGIMFAVQGVVEEKFGEDKTLSPETWARIEAKARAGEKALAEITALKKERASQNRKIKRLEDELEGKRKKRKARESMPSRQKLVDLIKDKQAQRVNEIRQKLLEKFALVSLKSIIGEKANLDSVSKNSLETAKRLEKEGGKSDEIYALTGWERGGDKKWRRDLPGKFAVRHKVLRSMLLNGIIEPLDAVLDAPELFASYPVLRDLGVAFETLPWGQDASFNPDAGLISLSDDLKWTRAVGLTFRRGGGLVFNLKHEVQHAIQELEGFSPGTTSQKAGEDGYRRKAGEVEARNAERRMDLSVTAKPISATEDVPRSEQILDEPTALKSILDDEGGFDEETLNDFSEIGAMFLTEGLAGEQDYLPEDFHAQMVGEFGDVIGADFQKIYELSWKKRDEWLSEIRRERTKENIRRQFKEELEDWEIDEILGTRQEKAARRRALEVLHRVAAGRATLSPAEEKSAAKIDQVAPTDEIGAAAKMLAAGKTKKEVFEALKDVSEVDKEKIYRQAVEVLSFAKKMKTENEPADNPIVREIEKIREEIKEGKKLGKKETAEALQKLRQFNSLMARLNNSAVKGNEQLEQIISETASSDEIALAASLIARNASLNDIYEALGVTDRQAQRQLLREANEVYEQAKEELKGRQTEILQQIAEAKDELRAIGDLEWQARQKSRQAAAEIAKEMERIKKGEISYRTGQVVDVLNASRTMMASFDLSAALRQGGYFTFAKPELQKEAFANMFKSFSEKNYGRVMQEIEAHPRFVLAQRAGIDFAEAGRGDTDHEELYRGKETIAKIPFLGKLLEKSVLNWSEQTYTAFLDTQRMVIFDALAGELLENGLSFERNKSEFEKIAQFINVATGRGTVPNSHLGKLLLDLPFFAPRYALSRLQLLNMTLNPVAYYNMPPAARKIVAKSALRFYGTTAAILFIPALLGLVSFDPDDDEFLKIKIGNTKYDIFAGLLPPVKMIIKIVHSAYRTNLGQDNRVPGEFWYDIADLDKGAIPRFVRGKLSPLASLVWDAASGKDFKGEEFSWAKGIGSRLAPITFFDIYEAAKLDGTVGVARSLPFAVFGVGVSNYKPRLEKPRTPAEKLAVKATAMKLPSKPQTREEKEQRERISELTFRSRMGEDVASEVKEMAKAGLIPEDKVKDILNAGNKSYLVDKAENLSLEEFEAVYRVANSKEKEELLPILNKKMKNAEKEGKLEENQRKELEKLGGHVLGDVKMPEDVKAEFERFNIKTPDFGETISLKKGEKTKLSTEQYEKYRREALERIFKKVQEKINSPQYLDANEANQEKMLRSVINKARAKELKETKKDLKKANKPEFQPY